MTRGSEEEEREEEEKWTSLRLVAPELEMHKFLERIFKKMDQAEPGSSRGGAEPQEEEDG